MKTLKSTIKLIVFALASLLYACSEPEVEPIVPVAEEKPSAPPKTEVKISVKAEDFEIVVDEMIGKGYVPSYIDGFIHLVGTKEKTLFNIIFREDEKTSEYKYFHGLNESGLEATIDLVEGTHNLIFLESYPQDDKILFAAIFRTGAPTQFHTELKIPYNQWQSAFDQMLEFGYRMACRSTVREGNDWYVSALFDKTPVGGWIAAPSLSPADMMDKIEEQHEKGRSISYFDVLQETTSQITFGAIFDSTTDTPVKKEMDMTSVQLTTAISGAINSGYILQTLSAYDVAVFNGDTGSFEVRYVATWKSSRGM